MSHLDIKKFEEYTEFVADESTFIVFLNKAINFKKECDFYIDPSSPSKILYEEQAVSFIKDNRALFELLMTSANLNLHTPNVRHDCTNAVTIYRYILNQPILSGSDTLLKAKQSGIFLKMQVDPNTDPTYFINAKESKVMFRDFFFKVYNILSCVIENAEIRLVFFNQNIFKFLHRSLKRDEKFSNLLSNDHYSQSALYALSKLQLVVKNYLKAQSNSKGFKSESQMMMTVFNENNPLIRINQLETPTEISEQEGFKFLITGLFKKYRNKYAHNQLEEIDKQECINILFMITECLDVLDNIPSQN